jgi:hypothetical protein
MWEAPQDMAASIIWAYIDKVEADRKGTAFDDNRGKFLERFPELGSSFSKQVISRAIESITAKILSGEVRKTDPKACLATLEQVRRMFA